MQQSKFGLPVTATGSTRLALDESTDQGDTAQLVIFIRGIDENLNVTEEMLDLCHMKGTTTGRDIYEYVNLAL